MKRILTTFLLAALSLPAFCQSPITLTSGNFPMPVQLNYVDETGIITMPPSGGANQMYDYSSAAYGTVLTPVYYDPSVIPAFPAPDFRNDSNFKVLLPTYGLGYYINYYWQQDASGSREIGMTVPPINYGLGALTGNSADTFYIPAQTDTFQGARWYIQFPASYGSTWSSVSRRVTNFNLTVTSAGLNSAPGQHVFTVYRKDSILGYGEARIPTAGGPSTAFPVLYDKIMQYTVDSFYLGGQPAPQQLVTAFSLPQGQVTSRVIRKVLLREGSWTSPVFFDYGTDTTYTTPMAAYIDRDSNQVATGIHDIGRDVPSSVAYPNPVTGRSFRIAISAAADPARVLVSDITGRVVESVVPAYEGRVISVEMHSALADGIYTYAVLDGTGHLIATGKLAAAK